MIISVGAEEAFVKIQHLPRHDEAEVFFLFFVFNLFIIYLFIYFWLHWVFDVGSSWLRTSFL